MTEHTNRWLMLTTLPQEVVRAIHLRETSWATCSNHSSPPRYLQLGRPTWQDLEGLSLAFLAHRPKGLWPKRLPRRTRIEAIRTFERAAARIVRPIETRRQREDDQRPILQAFAESALWACTTLHEQDLALRQAGLLGWTPKPSTRPIDKSNSSLLTSPRSLDVASLAAGAHLEL